MKKKKFLTLIISMVFVAISFWGGDINTNKAIAEDIISTEMASSIEEVKNRAAINYSTEIENISFLESKKEAAKHLNLKSITLNYNDITIETNGRFEFVDLIGETTDGQFINLSNYADWSSNNENVATAYMGRIIAEGKGETIVNVKFQEFQDVIKVKVLNEIDIKKIINGLEESIPMSRDATLTAISPTERTNIVNRAAQMVNCTWTPTKDLIGWRNESNYNFKKGITYTGIPYSQTEYQVNYNEFIISLGYSDFYASYVRFNILMPKYGNDCSGFVSFSWNISRHVTVDFINGILSGKFSKVGSYDANNPDELSLRLSYYNLQNGDAVVKQGHTFLIAANDQPTMNVYVYEQTPPKARYIIWNYEQMAISGYMPFSK